VVDIAENGFFVNPVREHVGNAKNRLFYNETTKEITYSPEYTVIRKEGMFMLRDDMREGECIKIVNATDVTISIWCKGAFLFDLDTRSASEIIALTNISLKNDVVTDDFIFFNK
jgi:hypothetical protein